MLHTEKSNVRSEQTIYLTILVREDSQNEHGAVVGQKMEHSSHTLIIGYSVAPFQQLLDLKLSEHSISQEH